MKSSWQAGILCKNRRLPGCFFFFPSYPMNSVASGGSGNEVKIIINIIVILSDFNTNTSDRNVLF